MIERIRETGRENKIPPFGRRGGSRRQKPLAHQNSPNTGRLEEGEIASQEKFETI